MDGGESREDDIERRSEQEEGVTVFGDMIGKRGDGWAHWSRGWGQRSSEGIERSGMRRVVVVEGIIWRATGLRERGGSGRCGRSSGSPRCVTP